MKNYKDSDYALNKYSEGIVYRTASGDVEITLAGYLVENPGKTESDFRALKELSDDIYLNQARDENTQTYKNSPIDELDEALLRYEPSPEDLMIGEIEAEEEAEKRRELLILANRALDKLTEVQRKRFLLRAVDGFTTREIAALEGVKHQSVVECLAGAEKKIKKFLASA